MVVEHAFHETLAVVEIAFDRDGVDVRCARCRHLPLLDRRHLAVRKQDEQIGALASGKGIDCSAARVAGRRADDGRALAAFGEHMVHQPRKQLHRHIFEGERRPVKQFEHELVLPGLHQWADRRMFEGCIGFVDDAREVSRADVAAGERGKEPFGQFGIGQALHRADIGCAELRPAFRQIQAAVTRQSGQKHVGKAQARGLASGADIVHVVRP